MIKIQRTSTPDPEGVEEVEGGGGVKGKGLSIFNFGKARSSARYVGAQKKKTRWEKNWDRWEGDPQVGRASRGM